MKTYKIKVSEKRESSFSVKAESLEQAKFDAKWRLLTQTTPSIEPQYTYTFISSEIDREQGQ